MKLYTKYMFFIGFLVIQCAIYAMHEEKSELFVGTYSENFVIRWAFQDMCHHCFDLRQKWATEPEGVTFNPEEVKAGDIIFVRDIVKFYKSLHKDIKHPYIMVTAGEYFDRVKSKYLKLLNDQNIIAWFSIHACDQSHPKFHSIPIGILQRKQHYETRSRLSKYFAQLRQAPKEKLLYMNFRLVSKPPFKPGRDEVAVLFENAPFCFKAEIKSFKAYMQDMSKCKFVLSPRGTAPDTYRTWEALLAGSIPIVESSHLDALYSDLPILIINDWHDLTEEFLERKYKEMTAKKWNIEKLFMEYWIKQIHKVREAFLKDMSQAL